MLGPRLKAAPFELVRIAFTFAFAEKLDPKLRQLTCRLQPNFVFDFQSTVLNRREHTDPPKTSRHIF
ncbi:MAG: hypothetical protein DME41_00800 [Verrucomicrobia bacterium]|nr:MAG: hypothetical protein DME41_00800 [Verrucomicrobiota bacterium]